MKRLLMLGAATTVVGLLVAVGLYVSGPFGWEPPEVAPLSTGQSFHAKLVLQDDEGYVVAGVAGTTQPDADDRCSGRFALVHLDEDGSPRRAVVVTGPEHDRFCASRVEALFPDDARGWVLSGSAVRRAEPGLIEWEPQTEHEDYTLRFSAGGSPDRTFGDSGLVRNIRVAGRVDDTLVTADLERVADDGEVLDDLWPARDEPTPSWSTVLVEDELLVALHADLPLMFRAFAVESARRAPELRALDGKQEDPNRTVELGLGRFDEEDVALEAGRLFVVTARTRGQVYAVDPLGARVVRSFGRGGRIDLTRNDLIHNAGLAVDGRGRLVVAFTTFDGDGDRLHVRRFAADGTPDAAFARVVNESLLGFDLSATELLVDRAGRILVLDALAASVTRLMPDGRFDVSFGENGVVSLNGFAVCKLPPARDGAPCRAR